jgi:hypothetical protein
VERHAYPVFLATVAILDGGRGLSFIIWKRDGSAVSEEKICKINLVKISQFAFHFCKN